MLEVLYTAGLIFFGAKSAKGLFDSDEEETVDAASPFNSPTPPKGALTGAKKRPVLDAKVINRNLVVASVSTGLAIGGFLYPPLAILSVPGMLYVSSYIHKRTFKLLKEGKVGVDTMVSFTTLGCLIFGYYFVGNFAALVVTCSQKLLRKVTTDSRENMIDVFTLTPNEVWVLVDGVEVSMPVDQVEIGSRVVVTAGEIIPVDGVIEDGMASIDQQTLTGEAVPLEKSKGDDVFASTVVNTGKIIVKVQRAGDETTIAKIVSILNRSIEFKPAIELKAHAITDKTVAPTFLLSGLVLFILGPNSALGIINAHFKYRMILVAPLSIMNYMSIASKNGLLIKEGRSLDLLNEVDTIVFDKTGTLTEDEPTLGTIHLFSSIDSDELLLYAAAAESKQSHPIAKAIVKAGQARKMQLLSIDDADLHVGYGLSVKIGNRLVQIGSLRFMEMLGVDLPTKVKEIQNQCFHHGYSLVMVAFDNELMGSFEMVPTIRPEAAEVIRWLKKRPQIEETCIISGDNEIPTRMMAEKLGIDSYYAETLPEEKAKLITKLSEQGKKVCYVGDGINDSIALSEAHVSISLQGASTIAKDTAQIILMDGGLSQLNLAFELSDEFQKNMERSFATQILPTIIGIAGITLFGFGLMTTVLLNLTGLTSGIGNAMLPLLREKAKGKRKGIGHSSSQEEKTSPHVKEYRAEQWVLGEDVFETPNSIEPDRDNINH